MSKAEEYINKIRLFKSPDLVVLWEKMIAGTVSTHEWKSGKALEYLILRAFELGGAEVTYPYEIWKDGKQIEQIDGVVYYKHYASLVECKDTSEPIDFAPLAKMRSQLMRRPATAIGSFFSVSGFTSPAIILATYLAPQTILLWESTEIEYVLKNNRICDAFVEKYRKYTESCQPDYNTIK